jgi:carbamate kinase
VSSDGWNVVEIPGRGFRRVVPSPKPRAIRELDLIRRMFDEGHVVVACGGGGIPVVERPGWGLEGVEAVIDKDLTAALLAAGVGANTLAVLTGVEKVCLHLGKPDETPLDTLTVAQAKAHLAAGEFPPGSMCPKIEACIDFLETSKHPDAQAFITSVEDCEDALAGKTGTRLVAE